MKLAEQKTSETDLSVFDYCEKTGVIRYNCNRSTLKTKGKVAGSVNKDGYLRIPVGGRQVFAHRLAWRLYHGEWPGGEIDHINRDKRDNRIANLRVVDRGSNLRNFPRRKNSKAIATGVYQLPSGNWRAIIQCNKQRFNLGTFNCLGEAIKARRDAVQSDDRFNNRHGAK